MKLVIENYDFTVTRARPWFSELVICSSLVRKQHFEKLTCNLKTAKNVVMSVWVCVCMRMHMCACSVHVLHIQNP